MLHILLMILKIIGIIIAVAAGLFLLTVIILTVAPLKYKLDAKCKGTLETLDVEVRYSWLYHFMSGWFVYRGKETFWHLRLAWKKFPERSEKSGQTESTEEAGDVKNPETIQKAAQKPVKESEIPELSKKELEKEHEKLFRKIQYTFQKICDRIKTIGEKKDKILVFLEQEIHRNAFKKLKDELLRLLRFLRPKKIQGRIHFGYEDPCNTGTTLAWLSMFYPFYGDHLTLEPDFHEKILEGELHVKGKIRGMHAVIVCFNLLRSREIRTTYKHIRTFQL